MFLLATLCPLRARNNHLAALAATSDQGQNCSLRYHGAARNLGYHPRTHVSQRAELCQHPLIPFRDTIGEVTDNLNDQPRISHVRSCGISSIMSNLPCEKFIDPCGLPRYIFLLKALSVRWARRFSTVKRPARVTAVTSAYKLTGAPSRLYTVG